MARKAKPNDAGSKGVTNLTATKDVIRNAVPEIVNLKKQRKELNERIAAARERVNAAGVPKAALDHAIRMREMDPEVRQAFDEGVAIVRDTIGVSLSRSLFDMLDERAETESKVAEDQAAKAKPPLGNGPNGDDSDLGGDDTPADQANGFVSALNKSRAHLHPAPDAVM